MIRLLISAMLLLPAPLRAETLFGSAGAGAEMTLSILSSTDIGAFAPLAEAFVAATPGARIAYTEVGTRELYETAMHDCASGRASADLLISSAMDLQVALVNALCAHPVHSPRTDALPDWAAWRDEVFGLTLEPAVLIYNKALVDPGDVPTSRFALIDLLRDKPGTFHERVVTYDVADSGVGYLFAFDDAQRATTFGRLIETLGRLNARLECCAAPMIDGVASGRYLLGYNVLGSYAAEAAKTDPNIGIVRFSDYSIAITRSALIMRHAENTRLAELFLDFTLSPQGQEVLRAVSLLPDDPEGDDGNLRPISLSPRLLVGLDHQKREDFLSLFFASFESAGAAGGNR